MLKNLQDSFHMYDFSNMTHVPVIVFLLAIIFDLNVGCEKGIQVEGRFLCSLVIAKKEAIEVSLWDDDLIFDDHLKYWHFFTFFLLLSNKI